MCAILSVITFSSLLLINSFESRPFRNLDQTYSIDFDKTNWSFDPTNGVYYQIGIVYCANAVNINYQSMAIYVPKEYLTCTEVSGKYSCEINSSGQKGSYMASTAPIVMPVETPGYAAMKAPTSYSYSTVSAYIKQGIIFAYAGCRGRYEGTENYIAGAPWAVTDLKSAIRYLRYNKNKLPGDTEKIYSFGMSGGGAQSCLIGITGNSELYTKYLEANGAAMKDSDLNVLKDNVKGSQCWCPITNLDTADAAYEWNIGQYYSTDTRAENTFTKLLSDDLTSEYVKYVNAIQLKDPNGNKLLLTNTNEGSYYDYLKSIIEESLNNFLSDTTFPWTRSQQGEFPRGNNGPGFGDMGRGLEEETYNTVNDYITYLNSNGNWVTYNTDTNKATITNVGDFIKKCKPPSKNVNAFDDLNRGQGENKVFGTQPASGQYTKHFDKIAYNLLNENSAKYSSASGWNAAYPTDYSGDFDDIDSQENNIEYRLNMYNPMYYLSDYYKGYKSSDVADYFRINSGIFQSDTGNVVELNLYLALLNFNKNVTFTTVWEQKHVKAERTGDSDTNFIKWIAGIENVHYIEDESTQNSSNSFNYSYLVLIIDLLIMIL